jgi:Na+/melibiose symporter-like transporter
LPTHHADDETLAATPVMLDAPVRPPHPHIPPLHLSRAVWFSLASIGAGMVFTFFNAQLPLYLNGYGVPHQLIGPLTNERSFAGALFLPFVGRMSDGARTPLGKRRPFFLVGIPLMAAALVLLGLHPPFWIMLTTVLLAGGFLFIALGPYQALMADITPESQRGQVGGFMALAGMVGAVLVSVIASFLWDRHGEWVFFATAGVLLLTFAVTFLMVREPAHHFAPPARASAPAVLLAAPALQPPPAAPKLRPTDYLRDVLRYKQTGRYIAAMSLYWLAAGGATPFITLFGTQTLHLNGNQASQLFLVLVLSTAAGTVFVTLLADRLGKKRVLHAGLGVFVLAALAASAVQDVGQAIPVMVLAGLGNACPTALGLALLIDLIPRDRGGEFIGLASFVWSIVQPLGSFFSGLLVDIMHSDRWAFGFAAVMMSLSVVALFFVQPALAAGYAEREPGP